MGGFTFDSKKEARRFSELRLLLRAGEIEALELQPEFPLWVTKDDDNDARVVVAKYVSDFRYINRADGEIIVEDTKGFRTPLYRLKKKMTEAIYGIRIVET